MDKKLIARTLIKRGRKIVNHINEYSDGSYGVVFGTPSQPIALSWQCDSYDKAMQLATKWFKETPTVKRMEF